MVTGATGMHGRTGFRVVERLLRTQHQVRVLVRRPSSRSEELAALGAEVVVGDLHERQSLLPALEGVGAIYFAYPVAPGIVPAAANIASAVCALDISPHVVVMSMAPASAESPSHLGRAQALAEEVMTWAGLDLTILRVAGFFFENIALLHAHTIRTGQIRNNFGDGAAPWISGNDAADLGARALLDPSLFSASSLHYPPGSELLTQNQIAAVLTTELNRPITYTAITRDQWRSELVQLAHEKGGSVNTDMALHISALGAALSAGVAPSIVPDSGKLEQLLGRPPLTFGEYVRTNLAVLL